MPRPPKILPAFRFLRDRRVVGEERDRWMARLFMKALGYGVDPRELPFGAVIDCDPLVIRKVLDRITNTRVLFPDYREGSSGNWNISSYAGMQSHPGYFGGIQAFDRIPILRRNQEIWMSITPMEIDSQRVAAAVCSVPNVAVTGLGMGFTAYNILRSSPETILHVYEKDTEVIKLFTWATSGIQKWEEIRPRLRIIHADVLADDFVPERQEYDACYNDIWPTLGDDRLAADTAKIAEKIKATYVYSWGQELMIAYPEFRQLLADGLSMDGWRDTSRSLCGEAVNMDYRGHPAMAKCIDAYATLVSAACHTFTMLALMKMSSGEL